MIILLVVLLLFLNQPLVHSATITAATCSASDVQTAITSSSTGDTVQMPSCGGTANWGTTQVTISSGHGIVFNCQGATIDASPGGFATAEGSINLVAHATFNTRVTNCTFIADQAIGVSGSPSAAAWRIDHNTFVGGSSHCCTRSASVNIEIQGNGPGLIDHNAFSAHGNSENIHNWGSFDNTGWAVDVVPGSGNAVYIEDNTFTQLDASWNAMSGVQAYNSARTVIRYNTFHLAQVDQHGTAGGVGARWWEIYNNTFDANSSQSSYMDIRGGSGVIYSNVVTGTPGTAYLTLREEDTGSYPELYQIGRGKCTTCPASTGSQQALDPAYLWSNDSNITLALTTPTYTVENRDFYQTTKPGYTAYPYPHPLISIGSTVPVVLRLGRVPSIP